MQCLHRSYSRVRATTPLCFVPCKPHIDAVILLPGLRKPRPRRHLHRCGSSSLSTLTLRRLRRPISHSMFASSKGHSPYTRLHMIATNRGRWLRSSSSCRIRHHARIPARAAECPCAKATSSTCTSASRRRPRSGSKHCRHARNHPHAFRSLMLLLKWTWVSTASGQQPSLLVGLALRGDKRK